MYTTRFPNRDQECFGCSLANYFELIRESTLADKVYEEFRKHPFVAGNGNIEGGLATRLVSDLTDNIYEGLLQGFDFSPTHQDDFLKLPQEQRLPACQAVHTEIAEKRVVALPEVSYRGEAILLRGGKKILHWLVDCGNGYVINDGKLKQIVEPDLFFSEIYAVLLIKPTR
ncbi:hypothetical protein HYT55_01325 [Candidatus Woesearchaeota archaeon]|nr:hypothetical protein [Candidatus Woesearchaeota archaeon]